MSQAISALLFLDSKGKPVLCRDYRGDVPLKVSDQFITKLNELEDANRASPVVLDDNISFIYIQYSNLYLLALSKTNSNATAILAFLHKIVEIFKHYFREVMGGRFSY
jgi:AP-1 complex subunit mu